MTVLPLRVTTEPDDRPDLPSLIAGARDGNANAFSKLVGRVEARVRRWAESFTGDADDADDVTQDVLILLEKRLTQFEGKSRFSTWLYRVTKNVALNRRRGRSRQDLRLDEMPPIAILASATDGMDEATITALVIRHFDELPARQREVFELSDIHGLSAPEIAERLGMKPVTVRANLFKARRTIRARMLALHPKLMEEYRS